MKRASEYPPPFESLTMLCYGDPGSGKTHFAGTFGNDVFYVNIGAGISTFYGPKFKELHGEWNPYLFTPDAESKTPVAIQVRDAIEEALDKLPDAHTIVIDDATALENIMMQQALSYNKQTKKSETLTNSNPKLFTSVIPAIQDYGTQMSFVDDFLASYSEACKNMQKNFIMLAHAKRDYGQASGPNPAPVTSIKPSFIGKKSNPAAYFDFEWYFYTDGIADQKRHRVITESDGKIEAKTRWGGIFPNNYTNPTYGEIKSILESYHATGKLPDVKSLTKPRTT